MSTRPILVSHALCPYVQRVAIVLVETGVAFERCVVDLAEKPAWFLAISPLGKTPVLKVGDRALFESAAICEYLDDTVSPKLHPADPLERAQHRAWMAFGSEVLNGIAGLYNATTEAALQERSDALRARFERVEAELGAGPYFAGARFCMVDAAFAPVFRYFDVMERLGIDVLRDLRKVAGWRQALGERTSVRQAVTSDYEERLLGFIVQRRLALSQRARASHPAPP